MSKPLNSDVPFGGITAVGEVSEEHPLFCFAVPTDVDELFDVYGSDAVAHDPNDDAHNYWVDVNTCAVEDFDEAEELDRMFADEPDDPPAADGTFEATEEEMITSSLYEHQVFTSKRDFDQSEVARPKKEVVRRRRAKRSTDVRLHGHPRRCLAFLKFKEGTQEVSPVKPGTLRLKHAT